MYNTWDLSDAEKGNVDVIWNKFAALIEPKSNYRLNRFHLQKFKQTNTESVDEFMTRCKTQARKCRFRDVTETEERLIEQLIVGVRHAKVQEKLLSRDENLTLDAALDVVRTHEVTLANMQQFAGDATVNYVSRDSRPGRRPPREPSRHRVDQPRTPCAKCGWRKHPEGDGCPAEGSRCNICGDLNHWSRVCRHTETETGSRVHRADSRRPRSSGRGKSRARSRCRSTQRRRDDHRSSDVHSVNNTARSDQRATTLVLRNSHSTQSVSIQ